MQQVEHMPRPERLSAAVLGAGVLAATWVVSPRSLFVATGHLRGEQNIALRGSPQQLPQHMPSDARSSGQDQMARVCCAAVGVLAAMGASLRRRGREPHTVMRAGQKDEPWERPGSFFDVLVDTDKFIEDDRRTSRPVFGYPEWKRQRSSDRLFRNLGSIPISSTIRANWQEVVACTLSAALVVLWNESNPELVKLAPEAVREFLTFQMVLPGLPFTLSSAALSLLLVFRTNQAYNRWWEARCIWGAIINTCRDVVRQSLVRFDPKDDALKAEVTRLVSAWPRSLIFHVGERTDLSVEVLEKKYSKILVAEEKERLMACTHKPMTLTGMIADAIRKANLSTIDEMKLDQDVSKFSDYYGMCERIFKTPIPLSYTRLTSRFLGVWMLFLPMALYGSVTPHWAIVPIVAVFAYLVFSIEEVGIQLEEPFSRLPMSAMADGIDASIFEALELDRKAPKTKVQRKPARSLSTSPSPVADNDAGQLRAEMRQMEQKLQAVTAELEKQRELAGHSEELEEPGDKSDLRQRVFMQQKQIISNERRLAAVTAAEEKAKAVAEERKQTLESALDSMQEIAKVVGAKVKKGSIIKRDMPLLELMDEVLSEVKASEADATAEVEVPEKQMVKT